MISGKMHFKMMVVKIIPYIQGMLRVCHPHDYRTVLISALQYRSQLSFLQSSVRNCSGVKDYELIQNCGAKSEEDFGDLNPPLSRTDNIVSCQKRLSKSKVYVHSEQNRSTFQKNYTFGKTFKVNTSYSSHSNDVKYQSQVDRNTTDYKNSGLKLDSKDAEKWKRIDLDLKIVDEVMKSSEKYPGDDYFKVSDKCLESLTEEQHINFQLAVKRTKLLIKYCILKNKTPIIPSKMTDDRWMAMMEKSSKSSWLSHMRFFCNVENKRAKEKLKKEQKQIEVVNFKGQDNSQDNTNLTGPLLKKCNLRMHFTQQSVNTFLYGAHIVVDLRYLNSMTVKENSLTRQQLMQILSINRIHSDPFHFLFCNAKESHRTVTELNSMWGVHECVNVNYTDMYPREQLVYLSPHSTNVLENYNHDDIYVIAGLVDKTDVTPQSMTAAMEDGIRTASFPLYKYLGLKGQDTSLTLDQVVKIMRDLKNGKSWETLLQEHVPLRKIRRGADKCIKFNKKKY